MKKNNIFYKAFASLMLFMLMLEVFVFESQAGIVWGCLCGVLGNIGESECDAPAKGVKGEICVLCPDDVLDVPRIRTAIRPDNYTNDGIVGGDLLNNCAEIDDDIITALAWKKWTSDGVKARLVSTENEDGTWTTVVTMFFPGIDEFKKCMFGTRRSRYLSMLVCDEQGNLHYIENAKRQGTMDTSTSEGSDDAGFTLTYTKSNWMIPPNYNGAY